MAGRSRGRVGGRAGVPPAFGAVEPLPVILSKAAASWFVRVFALKITSNAGDTRETHTVTDPDSGHGKHEGQPRVERRRRHTSVLK